MSRTEPDLAARFRRGTLDAASFGHRQHVEVAFALLNDHDFLTAAVLVSEGLRGLTKKAGVPDRFHLTITLAFLSAISERLTDEPNVGFEEFWNAHPELQDDSWLRTLYSPARLESARAKRCFLLPDRATFH